MSASEPDRRRRRRANGAGSVYQRKSDGRWVGAAYVLMANGGRRRVTVYGRTEEAATKALAEVVVKSEQGVPVPDRTWKIEDWLTYWLREYVVHRRRTTARGYESAVRLHLKPSLGRKRLDRLTGQDVRRFLAEFRNKCLCCTNRADANRPLSRRCCSIGQCCRATPSKRQIQYVHAVLRNALNEAMREELIMRNVATLVKIPAPRYRTGRSLTVEQVKHLLCTAEGHRLHPLYLVAATMGLRRGELLGLRWDDLDLDRGVLQVDTTVQRINGELIFDDAKSDESDEPIPIPEMTWVALLDHQKAQAEERQAAGQRWRDHGLVFPSTVGTPIEPRNLNRHFATLRERAGFGRIRLHDLRHTMVTLLMDLGVPPHIVQAIARHSDPDLTMKVYSHANLDEMRKGLRRLDDRLG